MDRGTQALVTGIVFTVLAALFIVLRCISRFLIVKRPGVEDYMILIALVLSIGLTVNIELQRHNGLGKHTADLPHAHVETTLKVRQALPPGWQCCTSGSVENLSTTSICLFPGRMLTLIAPLR